MAEEIIMRGGQVKILLPSTCIRSLLGVRASGAINMFDRNGFLAFLKEMDDMESYNYFKEMPKGQYARMIFAGVVEELPDGRYRDPLEGTIYEREVKVE